MAIIPIRWEISSEGKEGVDRLRYYMKNILLSRFTLNDWDFNYFLVIFRI